MRKWKFYHEDTPSEIAFTIWADNAMDAYDMALKNFGTWVEDLMYCEIIKNENK